MKTLIAALILALSTCAFSLVAFGADGTIPAKDLPTNLKGGKTTKASDGIPTCTKGRALVPASDARLGDWAANHKDHACVDAKQVYVCRVAGNLSMRCE